MTNNIDRLSEYVVHPTIHDKFCPCASVGSHEDYCECVLISVVRADERAVLRHEKTPLHRIIPGQGG